MPDNINHPPHYTAHPSGVECIQITRHMSFNLGNAFKYIWRADLKHDDGGLEDLKKAIWYLQDELAKRENSDPSRLRDYWRGVIDRLESENQMVESFGGTVDRAGPPTVRVDDLPRQPADASLHWPPKACKQANAD